MTCIIYCIIPLPVLQRDESDCYIGCTTTTLKQRFHNHKSNYKAWKEKKSLSFCSSFKLFDKFGFENCVALEIEYCAIENKRDREKYWINSMPCINTYKLNFDNVEYHIEYQKQQYKLNAEKLREYHKQRYKLNAENKKEYMREYRKKKKVDQNTTKTYCINALA